MGSTSHKVHGSKDKFNACSLLSVPFEEIPISDDEDEETKMETKSKAQGKSVKVEEKEEEEEKKEE